jgi:hypothetical protein
LAAAVHTEPHEVARLAGEQPVSGAPGPDGRHDDLDAFELEGLALLVPDDARSLDADRAAYAEELRARHDDAGSAEVLDGAPGGGLLERLRGTRLGRFGISGPMVVLALATVAVIGSSLTLFQPQAGSPASLLAPLATDPPDDVGNVGGLLPDTDLLVDGTKVPLRTARPALIVLLPSSCKDCGATLRSLLMQGREYGLRLVLAGPASQQAQLDQLDTDELGGSGLVAVDSSDVLTPTYVPTGITGVLVHEDGVVGAVIRDLTATQRLEPALAQLERPGAPTPAAS